MGVVVTQLFLLAIERYLRVQVSSKYVINLRKRIFKAAEDSKFAEISKYHSGDLLNRITGDVDSVQSCVVNIIPDTVSIFTKIIGCITALVLLEPRVTLIIVLFGVLGPAFGRLLSKRFKTLHKDVQSSEGYSRSFMQECFENMSVIKTFRTRLKIDERLDELFKKNYKFKMKSAVISTIMSLGLYALFTIGYYLILIWGAFQVAGGNVAFTYGTLTAFLQLVSQVRTPLQNVSGILPRYYSASASAERLMEIEDLSKDMDKIGDNEIEEIYEKFEYILVDNVTFGYNEKNILNNFSCKINRGSMTAILGDSGMGKSTLFKLLLSFYEPKSGSITINGEIPVNPAVRALFSYVPQGNMIISGSIWDNIAVCNPKASEEEIIKACKIAEIYDYIETLPRGLKTELLERGSGLSEGQLQRIAIARALVANTPVLLLDEATSALDKATEAKVLRNIKELAGKTVISVTHRTSNLNLCDNIINLAEKN